MQDLIDRQAAIEDIRTMIPKDARFDIKWIEMRLMQLPSATQTTTWLGNYCPYKCENCGHYTDSKTPYCAYCGREAVNVANS